MKTQIKTLVIAILMLLSISVWAQSTFKGKVVDAETGESVPGASVLQQGTTNGTATDIDGDFTLQLSGSGKLVVSFIGYSDKLVAFDAKGSHNLGTISLVTDAQALGEVVVIGSGLVDIVKDRQTPVAVSNISAVVIQEKSGNMEFPELMKNTPSIQVTGHAGGYGDSRINVRGFDQTNTAYLLNGQPINGMEDGKMYWSNWSGMNDIATAIQIQRGLGSSKLAISSVGGTVNIITKATEMRKGGLVRTTFGNDGYIKYTAAYNTGMTGKWGVSALFTYWQGDGYMRGTKGQGQNYFFSVGFKPNEKHMFNFLLTGAPQWHDQAYNEKLSTYLERGKRFNDSWGYLNGEYKSLRRNYYHKPVLNLNWDWNISEKSSLSTVLYASFGRGGGTGSFGNGVGGKYFPQSINKDGLVNWNAVEAYNYGIAGGFGKGYKGSSIRASVNNHQWYGVVSNFERKLTEKITFNVGADLRRYTGVHFRQLVDMLGLKGWNISSKGRGDYRVTNTYKADPWAALTDFAPEEDRVAWDYDETIQYAGTFGQIEYNTEHLSAYFQGAISTQSHDRTDRFQYAKGNQDAETVKNSGYNVKAGLNYKFNEKHSVFGNVGKYSRQPFHDNIYLNYGNDVNPFTSNEDVFGLEFGYQFRSLFFDLNLNLYNTSWDNRVTTSSNEKNGVLLYTVNEAVGQLHKGVEVDFRARPFQKLSFNGFLSYGNWEYDGTVLKKTYDEDRKLIDEKNADVDGGKVGDSPQFQMGLGFVLRPMDNLKFDMDWKYNDKLYAARIVTKDNLELPSYSTFDAGLSYEEVISKDLRLKLRFNVNNLLNTEYISEVTSNIKANSGDETYKGINVNNEVKFGLGRTFNISATLKF